MLQRSSSYELSEKWLENIAHPTPIVRNGDMYERTHTYTDTNVSCFFVNQCVFCSLYVHTQYTFRILMLPSYYLLASRPRCSGHRSTLQQYVCLWTNNNVWKGVRTCGWRSVTILVWTEVTEKYVWWLVCVVEGVRALTLSPPGRCPQVCREFQRGACKRPEAECRFAHPARAVAPHADGSVTVCMDAVKGRCGRDPCRYFHPPLHLQAHLKAQARGAVRPPHLPMHITLAAHLFSVRFPLSTMYCLLFVCSLSASIRSLFSFTCFYFLFSDLFHFFDRLFAIPVHVTVAI